MGAPSAGRLDCQTRNPHHSGCMSNISHTVQAWHERVHSLQSLLLPSQEDQSWSEGGLEIWMRLQDPIDNVFPETLGCY